MFLMKISPDNGFLGKHGQEPTDPVKVRLHGVRGKGGVGGLVGGAGSSIGGSRRVRRSVANSDIIENDEFDRDLMGSGTESLDGDEDVDPFREINNLNEDFMDLKDLDSIMGFEDGSARHVGQAHNPAFPSQKFDYLSG
jgi:hypothetical protein